MARLVNNAVDFHTYRCGMYAPEGTHDDTFICDCPCHPMAPTPTNLYRVCVTGDTADNTIGNLFSDEMYFRNQRISPVVVYIELSERDAIELAQRNDFEVTRARRSWSI